MKFIIALTVVATSMACGPEAPPPNYETVKVEDYSAWVGGRFQPGRRVNVIPEHWDRVDDIVDHVAKQNPGPVVVFFWNERDEVGKGSAVYGVELIEGSLEVLVDQR